MKRGSQLGFEIKWRWLVVVLLPWAAVLSASEGVCQPACEVMSANGHFHLRVLPEDGKVPLNSHHSWIIEVESDVGDPVELRGLAVSGGMPGHGHGLPSQPRVTEYLGGGRYRVDGLMFNMHGEWQLNLSLSDGLAQDHATLVFNLDY